MLARQPDRRAKVRASALQAGPMISQASARLCPRYGSLSWLEWPELSTAITPEKAAAYRAQAGLDSPPSDPNDPTS